MADDPTVENVVEETKVRVCHELGAEAIQEYDARRIALSRATDLRTAQRGSVTTVLQDAELILAFLLARSNPEET